MTGRLLLGLATLVALFVNLEVASFQYSVLTEGLFLPITMLFLAAVMAFVYRGTTGMALAAAALAGLAVAVRPLSLPLVGVILVAILVATPVVTPRRTVRQMALLCLAVVAVWGGVVAVERGYSRWRHGDQLTSLAGRHVFAKAALIDGAPLDTTGFGPLERRLTAVMERDYAPVRQWLRRAEGTVAYPVMLTFYETCIQHNCSNGLRRVTPVSGADFNDALLRVGGQRLLHNPAGFAALAVSQYKSLWVLFSRRHPAFAPDFDAYVANARPLPLEAELDPVVLEPSAPSRAAYVIRPAFMTAGIVIFVLTFAFGYLVLRRRAGPGLTFAWLCALSVQFMAVFIALTGLGEGRYTMGMWPSIAMTMLFAALVVYEAVAAGLRSRKAVSEGHALAA